MVFSSDKISSTTAYKLLVSTVLPRPIAFVTTIDDKGCANAAPFSFFNAMGSKPPVIVLGFEPNSDGTRKDTPSNIEATKEFVVNIVDEPLSAQMSQCAASVPSSVDELAMTNLNVSPSITVKPPLIQESPVSMECKLRNYLPLEGGGQIIIGEVIHFHVRDNLIVSLDPLRISSDSLAPISRLSGSKYGRITDQFEIVRPK